MHEPTQTYDIRSEYRIAAQAEASERLAFIKKTYAHLIGSIVVFVALVAGIQTLPIAESMTSMMTSAPWVWLLVLMGVFGITAMVVEPMARNAKSVGAQYTGLGIYILLQAAIFTPMIFLIRVFEPEGAARILLTAGGMTICLFAIMSCIVFITRKDFSFLRSALIMGMFIAIGLIVVAILTGMSLGPIFTVAMIGFACLFILYDTSNVLHHYQTNQHIVAALALFASFALLLWYVIRFAWYLYNEH